MKKGIIFDMDGTIWDTSRQVAEAWNIALEKCGYQRSALTETDLQGVMGMTMDGIAKVLFPDETVEQQTRLLDACCEEENGYLREHGGTLYPDLRETLVKLREKYHVYIVSNCQSGYIESFLDFHKFHDLVEDIQCYGDNGRPKSDNIRILCDRNGLDDAVYVGDIQKDYDSSMEAKVKFIHAAYGFGTINVTVPRIKHLRELPEVVEKVFA